MQKVLKALVISAAATGAAALLLKSLRLDEADSPEGPGFPGMEPEDLAGDDLEMLMDELASQLEL